MLMSFMQNAKCQFHRISLKTVVFLTTVLVSVCHFIIIIINIDKKLLVA